MRDVRTEEVAPLPKLYVKGHMPLEGSVRIGGRKNSAVAVLPAALLAETPSVLENLPQIQDVKTYAELLNRMGATSKFEEDALRIDPRELSTHHPPDELVKKMRASYYLLGVLLAKEGHAEVALPGGCDIGQRPIDQHIKGFKALGADVVVEHGVVKARAEKLIGDTIYLDVASVGATINIMLAASLADGLTVIENAAKESHIVDLANYLNAMGVRIVGAGTDVIKIHGTDSLQGVTHAIIPDEIEAATYMMAAAATRGSIRLDNIVPKHLDPISAKLREAGAEIVEEGESLTITLRSRPSAINVKTLPYPGFPTDAQQPMTVVLALADGTSMVSETVWESRFKHVDELQRMGCKIKVEGRTAIIEGVETLYGAHVKATDLRAGASLVVAALAAEGESLISGMEHVDRGYELMDQKLRGLGARVTRLQNNQELQEPSTAAKLRSIGRIVR
jgi:UDP-N-acetylglucosamine 1-carboxyvinyltransferase